MPTTTYIIRFAHRYRPTSVPYEEQEHTNLADAWEAYRLLTEPTSAEVYSQIELGTICIRDHGGSHHRPVAECPSPVSGKRGILHECGDP